MFLELSFQFSPKYDFPAFLAKQKNSLKLINKNFPSIFRPKGLMIEIV